MSRPLTGRIKANPSGTFTASLPASRGSSKRVPRTFRTKKEAQRWLAEAVTAVAAGKPVPEPARAASVLRIAGTRFRTIAEAHIRERYVEDGYGDVDRENQVRGYVEVIDAYMEKHNLSVETITHQDARRLYQHLLKVPIAPTAVDFPEHKNPDAVGTIEEALAMLAEAGLPCSPSTFKRARKTGRIEPIGKRGPAHLYRFGDLYRPEAGLAVSTQNDGARYSHSTLQDVRRTFRAVLAYAEAEGISLQPRVRAARLPKNRVPKATIRAMTLEETGRVAARLHVVHQLVLWLLRLLGLRVSEAYGLLVEDVVDAGAGRPGILTVQSQGGRKFNRRGPNGETVTTDHVDHTKADSWRILVVPAPLMDVIRVVIDVFHTDPDGHVRTKARLVPGLQEDDKAGQSAFRNALTGAASAEGLDMRLEDTNLRARQGAVTVTPTPQTMRQSFATALQASREVVENIRAYMGHRRGSEVIHQHYILEDLEMKPQRDVADAMTKQIATLLPDGLMVPTATSCTTGRQPALAQRAAEVDAKLIDLGWFVEKGSDGDWICVAQAAELRGVTTAQILDDIRNGRLRAIETPRVDQAGFRYLVDASRVLEMADRLGAGSRMRQVADELGEPYDKIRQYIHRHPALSCEARDGDRDYHVPDEVADHVRSYFTAQHALAERAIRMPEVAKRLGISVACVKTLIKHGELQEDDRFHGGVQSVTRVSLETYLRRGRRRLRN
jgi:integrase